MLLTSTSAYGHSAIFHSSTATPADLASVTWTLDSIHVPSTSSLNAPADVWFHHPTTLLRAKTWCESQNVRFLGLSRSNGAITGFGFRVQGFSRYKYVDSDDDAPRRGVKAVIEDDEEGTPPPKQFVFDIPSGQDDAAVHTLRSALFDRKDEHMHDVSMQDVDDDVSDQPGTGLLDFGDDLSDDDRIPAMPIHELPFPVYEYSVAAEREGNFCDTGLMLGRSSRLSFAKGIQANSLFQSRAPALTTGFCLKLEELYGELPQSVADLLRVHCVTWFRTRVSGTEICNPSLIDAFRDSDVADQTVDIIVEELWRAAKGGDDDARHARVVFWLILSLYKGGDAVEVERDCLIRRLADWAEDDAGALFDERSVVTGLRKALLQLCVGQVEEAVDTAVDSGYIRLATMVSRALENPKDDLRLDAEAQLAVYGLVDVEELEDPDLDPERWDKVLADATPGSTVSIDERMILLLLAGHVAPVARFMRFSWYRLFILELLYGAGSSELTQPERVAAAVQAIEKGKIETTAPHAATEDVDVAYHLLRLYADPTTKYPLTSGVYSNSSFGMTHRPLDSRFSWLLHQVLSSLIPEAGLKNANVVLADAFAAQLRAGGMPLWAFYVLCSGGVSRDVLRETIVRDWPEMVTDRVKVTQWIMKAASGARDDVNADQDDVMRENGDDDEVQEVEVEDDTVDAEMFLAKILRVPESWIYEAKALSARADGDKLEECRCWIRSGNEEAAARAHELLCREVVPEAIVAHNTSNYGIVTDLLKELSELKFVPNWHSSGDLLLSYLERIIGVPQLRKSDMQDLRSMVARLPSFAERSDSPVQRHASCIMADGIATAQRALSLTSPAEGRDVLLSQLKEDVERLPCTPGVRKRLLGEYNSEVVDGRCFSTRFSAALTCYAKFVTSEL